MNTGTDQYYSAVMRDVTVLFCKAEFYGSQNTGWEVERVWSSEFVFVSNTAPRCSSSALHNSPLMMMPRSTPLLVGSLTWKVPLLGTTDSDKDLDWREKIVLVQNKQILSRDESLELICTCNIELDLHCHLVGQSWVPQQLMGLLQSAVLGRDPIDGQQSVADLQQPTPVQNVKCRWSFVTQTHSCFRVESKTSFYTRPMSCN